VLLAVWLVVRGLLPAWRDDHTDFLNYWLPARVWWEGGSVGALYRDSAFAAAASAHDLGTAGKVGQFPPPTIPVVLPLGLLPHVVAMRGFLALKLVVLGGVCAVAGKVARAPAFPAAVAVLAMGDVLANDFRFGQIYLPIALVLLLATPALGGRSPTAALFGVVASIKLFPAVWVPIVARRREGLAAAAAGVAVAVAASLWVVGAEGWEIWLGERLLPHLDGRLTAQSPLSLSFQSFDVLLRRSLGEGSAFQAARVMVTAAVVGVAVRGWTWASTSAESARLRASVLGCAGMALAPATASYHGLLLVPAVAWAWPASRARWALLASVALLGWIPYGLAFRAADVFLPLGFPRLWLTCAALAAAVWGARPLSAPQ
jgi:hypothetical protein